jgi:Rieske Fe-S protein
VGPSEEGPGSAAPWTTEAPEAAITRRSFLKWGLGSVTGAMAAILAAFGLPPIIAPAFRRLKSPWSPIGKVGEPEAGQPDLTVQGQVVSTTFTRTVTDAFMPPEPQETAVFVVNLGNDQFTVFDGRCTHLGCPVSWDEMTHEFYCPCHGGVYDAQGDVVAGPPPRPLDRYEWKVQGGVLYAGRLYRVKGES